jgi:hypothetical protein
MSFATASNPTQFFSVVGAAYVPENHGDYAGQFVARSEAEPVEEQIKSGLTGLWVSFFAVIGISLINHGQAVKAVHFASTALQ